MSLWSFHIAFFVNAAIALVGVMDVFTLHDAAGEDVRLRSPDHTLRAGRERSVEIGMRQPCPLRERSRGASAKGARRRTS